MKKNLTQLSYRLLLLFPLVFILSAVTAGTINLPAVSSSIIFTNPIQNNNMFLGIENTASQEGYTLPATILGAQCREIPAGKFMYVYSSRTAVPTSAANIIISITYYDSSMNSIWINYTRNGNAGGWGTADFQKSNTKKWITRIITITDAGLDGSMGYGGDIRMGFGGENNYIKDISISVGTLNPLTEPVPAKVNAPGTEFIGKSFAGYQLWHQAGATPQDWLHWSYGMLPAAGRGNHNTETFPHISDYNGNSNVTMYPTNFANLGDGSPTKLYNSTDQGVIDVQMSLLKNAGFDGVAIQRNAPIGRALKASPDDYYVSIKNACENNGRLFYVMYCMPDTNNGSAHLEDVVAGIERDWVYQMEQVYALTSSSAYATVNGKPVVELWGLGYSTIEINNPQALALAAFFKARGCYVIAGTPRDWRLMNEGSRTDFSNVYKSYDMISPWTVGAYNDTTSANNYKTNYQVADKAYCDANGMGYYPVVFVGSAWSEPVSGYPNDTKRVGGKFLWKQAQNATSIGVKSMYFAMLDEFEESTDIINAATDYFDIPTDQYFGTLAMDGIWCSPDYYLRLGGAAARMVQNGTSQPTITTPYSLGPIYYRNSFESRVANCIINNVPQNIVSPIDACFYNATVITNTAVTSPSVTIVNPATTFTKSGVYSTQITGTATGASKYYYQVSETKIAVKANMALSFWKYSANTLGQNTSVDLIFKSGKTLHSLAAYTDNNGNAMTPTIARGTVGTWQKFNCQIGKGVLIGDEIDGIAIAYDNPAASGNFNAYFDDIIIQDAADTTASVPPTSNGINYPALLGYWQNWDDPASPYIQLDQVDPKYNNVIVAFATPVTGTTYQIDFTPYNVSQATFISQIQTLQSQGRKVLISIGGEGPVVSLTNAAQKATFISTVETILNTYGFDGVDIDFEGASLSVSGGTIAAPTDAAEINLIAALKQIMQDYRAAHNKKMLLTMAPEAADVQGGMSAYGGIWGSYLPVINGLKDSLDVLQVQLYNTGSMYGIDGGVYTEGTADFIVAETEAAIKGFSTAGGLYGGLPANKVAVGLPTCAGAAGGGFTDTATVHAAMNYLLGKGPKPGSYTLQQPGGYPTLEGMMGWSINYDKICSNDSYATNFQNIFSTTTPVSETPYGGTPWPIPGIVQAENYDNGGQGTAYNDADAANQGGQYRTTEGVDIETTTDAGGGFDVGYTSNGEWLKYSVNVTASGTYNIGFRTAATSSTGVIRLEVDGVDVTGPVNLPNTGDYQAWVTTTVSNINLTAGLHTVRLFIITGGFNLNYFTVTAPSTGPGYLQASGKNIVNNSGNFVIKAINIGDFMIQEGYMMNLSGSQYIYKQKITAMIGATACDQFYANYYQNFVTKTDIDSIKKMGFNTIRLPLNYELFTPLGQPTVFLTQGFAIVDSIVSWCKADNIYVVLDLHAAPGGQNTGDISDYDPSQPSLWESTANQNQTVALWAKLAQRYANEQYVGGYDLINETNWTLPGNTLLYQLMQNITTAIRQVDNNHILFIEGNSYANDYTGMTPKWDNNMAYSFHKYWNDNLDATLNFALAVRDGQNVPIWMGEFGENSNNWIADAETLVNKYNIGWAIWPYKKMSSVSSVSSFNQPVNWAAFANYVNGGAMPSAAAGQAILNELLQNIKVSNCTINNGYLYALFKQPGNTNTIPYNNIATVLPGKIIAANYDEGKNGYAYNDSLYQDTQYGSTVGSSTTWNNGWYYRNDGVDLQYSTAENGPTIGWTETNDWMQYTVNISTAGSYNVIVRAASGAAGGKISISSDGTTLISNATIAATGGWDTWQNFNLGNVALTAGTHKIVVTITAPGYNLSYLNFTTLAPVITSPLTTTGTTGTGFNYNITATNTPTSYSVSGTLPAGLNLNTSTGLINGTPTIAGTFIDTIKATNAAGTGIQVLTITINTVTPIIPVITSAAAANGTAGTAFGGYTITATNTPTSYSVTGTLPAGLNLNTSTGLISGTPTAAGTFIDTVKATNANGTGTKVLTITISTAPTGCSTSMIVNATSVPTIDGTVDAVWNNAPKNTIAQTISGTIQTGSTWQAMYDATNLYVLVQVKDANLSSIGTNVYDQDGVELFLSGNNSKAGAYNATYDHQYRFNWNVTPSVANISGNTNSKTGITYAIPTSAGGYTLEAAIPWTTIGGAAPYNGEPIGFDVNLNDQQNNAGAREATAGWYLTNNDDYQNTAGFGTVNLTVCAATTPVITSAATANGTVNAAFTYNVTATSTPTSYSVGGVLPAGVTINTATGVISGTPTVTGTFVDTVKATNAGGTGTQVVTITINPAIPVVNSGSTTGTVGTAFSYTISATNNPTSYSSTILPAGLILNATTGVISGTPTIAGTFTITDTAKNISGAGNGTLTIVINPAKPIVANTSTTGTVGAAFSYTISATNNPTSYTSTTLPAGLTLNTSTGIISGTPTTAGTFTVTDTAKNISGAGNGTLTIVINPAKPVVANASTTGTVGAAFSYPISATNSPTSYSSTILPAGLTLNISTGIISGTPTTAGTFTITDTAKNISGAGNGTLTIVINLAKPVVANASTIGTVGTAFSYTISATNNPTSYSSTILPAGLILNATTGVISGTPTTAGTFTVTDTAKNISGAGNGTLTIVINPARPVISSASVNGTTGVAFSYTIAATNNPTSYGASALPAGLGFNPTTGTISGTPTTAGTFIINDTATNISGSGTGTLTITITTILPPAPVVTSGSITGTVGIAFNYSIIATNSPTGYSSTTLPAGLSLNSAGIISGIPTTAGTFVITDTAKNAGGAGTGTLTIVINPAKPVVANASTTGTVGTVFSYTISATNSPTSYSSTTLPAGLSLNTSTGIISGTPTTAGTFTVTDTAKNISGAGNGTLTIVINPAKPVVANTSTTGTVGTAFSYTISATNNPTSYSSTALPAGLSLNTSTGIISGTPTTAGTFTIIDTAKNISGAGNGTLTIVINPAKPVVANTSTTGTVGTAFSYTISATNNPTSYSSTVLPTGLSLNTSTGLISGTPTTAGTFTIADTAKNISGAGNGTLTIVINPAKPLVANASTTGTVGTVFSYTISATNNPTSYNSTTLPAGLTLNTALGVITGTPTIAGTFTVTDTAKNISGAGNGTLTIVINPAKPVISSASVNGTTGVAFNYTIAATNNPTSYGASALPAGLGFNPTTGTISGTPTTAGTFVITDTAKNAGGNGTGTITITINPAKPVVTAASTTAIAGTVGVAFNYSIIATNSPTGYSSTTLPAGLSLNSAGIISGIPTTAGTFVITDTAKNAGGNGTGTITITINPAKPVVTAASTTGTVGIIFSYTIIATNNPTSYSSTILPAGLILNTSTGVISGTPTTAGTFTITDTAKNISGAGTGTLTIVINPAKPVVANASTTGTVGTAFSYTINATNNPTSYSSTTLPAGLSLNTSTGIISGTPTTAGTFTITDTAKNISGAGNGTLTITINPPLPTVPVVSSAASATGTVGVAFNYTITASNNPISYAATNNLPAGLTINPATGVISGTPTVAGTFVDTIKATNAAGTGTKVLTITIVLNPPVITSSTVAGGNIGTAFNYAITATNNPTSYTSTTLPAGLTINTSTGVISGTPTVSGTFTVTLTATNAAGSGTQLVTIIINALPGIPVIGGNGAVSGIVNVPFEYDIVATNAVSYNASGLPTGLSINTTTGKITGTPVASGSYTVTISATNTNGTQNNILEITITAAPLPIITSDTAITVAEGDQLNYAIEADNAPTSYAATGLPAGVTINTTTGIISGVPTVSGVFKTTITATNSAGSTSEEMDITVIGSSPVLMPNPVTQGYFILTLPHWTDGETVNVIIRNFIGKEVQSGTAVINNGSIHVNVPNLIAGNYVAVVIGDSNKKVAKKFTVK